MSDGRLIGHKKILSWAENYKNNKTLPSETNSAAISLSELEAFIKAAKESYKTDDFNGIRIYFVRYPLSAGTERIGTSGNNLSQTSLVLVPVKSFNASTGSGDDYKLGTSEQVYALAFADPDSPDPQETYILCPPKCG